MNMEVIGIEKKLCTCCMEEHAVKTVRVKESTVFKNVPVDYEAIYLYCDTAEELYMDESMINKNDVVMKDAYRKTVGLLTAKEISSIREKYGISQRDLCILLGWGEKTITRYEGHQIQDRAHDAILKKLEQDPEWFLYLLFEAKETLSPESYRKYFESATILYENDQDSYLRKSIEARYVRFHNKHLLNGNTPLSLDKVVDVIRYFAASTQVINLYKVKLMKMLWYADMLSYKERAHAITGLVYQALPMGAVPIGHDSIIDLKGVPCEEVDMGDGTAYRFSMAETKIYPAIDEEDKKVLDIVIEKLGKLTKDEIVTFMHGEKAYIETMPRDVILFRYADSLRI